MRHGHFHRAAHLPCLFAIALLLVGRREADGLPLVLKWSEEFDGNELNSSVWTFDTGNGCDQGANLCGWGNNEQQTYTMVNHDVSGGELVIKAKRESSPVDDRWYTSSRLRTTGPATFLTGRVEAKIDLPRGSGLWGAFWMLPVNTSRGVWAATGEIDIMEGWSDSHLLVNDPLHGPPGCPPPHCHQQAVNEMDSVGGTIHYGGEWPENRFAGCWQSSGLDLSEGYHVYTLDWAPDEMKWLVDGQLYCQRTDWESDIESYAPYRAPFDTEFQILLNLAVGGNLPRSEVDDTALPAEMRVDYVRVYEVPDPEPEPYFGQPLCLPGEIQAEAYDNGGMGVAFSRGGSDLAQEHSLRPEGLEVLSEGGRIFVPSLLGGEWVAYSVYAEGGMYDITLQVATTEAAALQLVLDAETGCTVVSEGGTGSSLMGSVEVIATGGEGEFGVASFSGVVVPEGAHTLKVCIEGGVGLSLDMMTFNLVTTELEAPSSAGTCVTGSKAMPFMFGEPWVIPGYIEAEFFDRGGEGLAFHDASPGSNEGDGSLRPGEGVDIYEAHSNPSRGHYVGGWEEGEWLSFTATAEEGYWDVLTSVASGERNNTHTFRIILNSTECQATAEELLDRGGLDLLGGSMSFDFTGSWEAFVPVVAMDVWVPAGTHRVVFCSEGSLFNLDYLRIYDIESTPTPTTVPTPYPTPTPTPTENLGGGGDGSTLVAVIVASVVGGLALLFRLLWIVYSREASRKSTAVLEENNSGEALPKGPPHPPPGSAGGDKGGEGGNHDVTHVLEGADQMPGANGMHSSMRDLADQQATDPVNGSGSGEQITPRAAPSTYARRPWQLWSPAGSPHSITTVAAAAGLESGEGGLGRDMGRKRSDGARQRPLPRRSFSLVEDGSVWDLNLLQREGHLRSPATGGGDRKGFRGDRGAPGALRDAVPVISPVLGAHGLPVSRTGQGQAASPLHPTAARATFARGRRTSLEDVPTRPQEQVFLSSGGGGAGARAGAARRKVISRSRSAMLSAGTCWTCRLCTFENSDGQHKCLQCGRPRPQDLFSDLHVDDHSQKSPLRRLSGRWIPAGNE